MDEQYMRMAIELAKKGAGKVNPNPQVGCVAVSGGRVIASGYHERFGGYHAERSALLSCTESTAGATLYVTLEPCCHYGKTPPCTEIIIQKQISRVVVGCLDPNPLVAGKGIELLRAAGIEVKTGVLEKECTELNEIFFHYIRTGLPFVTLKYAMTADGKTATATGRSRWITGEKSRANVHKDRNLYSAIMAGIDTVLTDDPMLNCRMPGGRDPLRVICDTQLRLSPKSRIARTAKDIPTIAATCSDDTAKRAVLEASGIEVVRVPCLGGHVDLRALMELLGRRGTDSVFLEGGSTLNYSALQSGIVSKVQAYIAPKIFGGSNAPTPVGGAGICEVSEAYELINSRVTRFDDDIMIESEVRYPCLQA